MDIYDIYEPYTEGLSALNMVAQSLLNPSLSVDSTRNTISKTDVDPMVNSILCLSSNSSSLINNDNYQELNTIITSVDKHIFDSSLSPILRIVLGQYLPLANNYTNTTENKNHRNFGESQNQNNNNQKNISTIQYIDRSSISTAEYLRLCKLSSIPINTYLSTSLLELLYTSSLTSTSLVRHQKSVSSSNILITDNQQNTNNNTGYPSLSDSESEDPLPASNDTSLSTISPSLLQNINLWTTRYVNFPSNPSIPDTMIQSSINTSIIILNGYAIAILDAIDQFPLTGTNENQTWITKLPFPASVTVETLKLQKGENTAENSRSSSTSTKIHNITVDITKGYAQPIYEPIESKMNTRYNFNYSQLIMTNIQHESNTTTWKLSPSDITSSSTKLQLLTNSTSSPSASFTIHRRYLVPLLNEGHTLCFVLPTIFSQLRTINLRIVNIDKNFQGIQNIICPSHNIEYSENETSKDNYMNITIESLSTAKSITKDNKINNTNNNSIKNSNCLPLILLIEPKNINYQWKILALNNNTLPKGFVSGLEFIYSRATQLLQLPSTMNTSSTSSVTESNVNVVYSPSSETNTVTLSSKALPRHIAVVMDGNGRWAQSRGLKRSAGHRAGVNAIHELIRSCRRLRIPYLTLYAFSAQNWTRPEEEVRILMTLLAEFVATDLQELCANGVRLIVNGEINKLPPPARNGLLRMISASRYNTGLTLCLALSYGGREEIVGGVLAACRAAVAGLLDPNTLTPESFRNFLPHTDIPDPDLLIRTSGELRVSNFLLWQIAYTELYVTNTLWPDFDEAELTKALLSYANRERRFGKTSAQIQEENINQQEIINKVDTTISNKLGWKNESEVDTIKYVQQIAASMTTETERNATTIFSNSRENDTVTLYQSSNTNNTVDKNKKQSSIFGSIHKWYTMASYYLLGTTIHDAIHQLLNSDENNQSSLTTTSNINHGTEEELQRKLHRKSIYQRLSFGFQLGLLFFLSVFVFVTMRNVTMNTWTSPLLLSNKTTIDNSIGDTDNSKHYPKYEPLPNKEYHSCTMKHDEYDSSCMIIDPSFDDKLSNHELSIDNKEYTNDIDNTIKNNKEIHSVLTSNQEDHDNNGKSNSPWPWPATAHPPYVGKV